MTSGEKVESRSAATASYQASLGPKETFWSKQKFATSVRSLNIRPGNIEKVLTSREKVASCSAANSSYHASLADEETFLFQEKDFSSYRVLKLSGRKKVLEKRKTRQLARRRLRRLKRQKVEGERKAITLTASLDPKETS